jgi:hypothetical protein
LKNIVLIITLFIGINFYGQKDITLFFRNGDSLKVISYLTSGNTKIKYRESEDSKKITVDYRKVEKAVKHNMSFDVIYKYKIKQGCATPVLLEEIASGKMCLYKIDFTRNSNFGAAGSMSSDHSEYYICKEDNSVVTTFNASGIFIENGFRKKSREAFEDCPKLT